jgi:hypothetical protein
MLILLLKTASCAAKLGLFDTNDWAVDTSNQNAITMWASNVTAKGHWAASTELYSAIVLDNTTAADFSFPRTCNVEVCEHAYASRRLVRNGIN